jgi:outer membrane protein OmpA-like peptidoglycan-associated protein
VRSLLLYTLLIFTPLLGGTQTKIKSFYFENDQSVPTPYSQNQLKLFKSSFKRGEVYILEIYSYTDSIGSVAYNDSLARKRLNYVSNYLGVTQASTVQLKPYGLVRKYDVKDYKSWRRVDIYYSYSPPTIKNVQLVNDSVKTESFEEAELEVSIDTIEIADTLREEKVPAADTLPFYSENSVPYILNVEFFEGTAKMDIKSEGEVKEFAEFLKEHSNLSVQIRGHVCCGNNMRISKHRARAVYHELIKQGIDKNRLDYVGMSNKEPLVFPEKTNADRQRNRRVDVKFKVMDL